MNQVTLDEIFVMTKCLVDFMLFYCVCFYLLVLFCWTLI